MFGKVIIFIISNKNRFLEFTNKPLKYYEVISERQFYVASQICYINLRNVPIFCKLDFKI